ncbi:MAG: SMC-Scp complex subunit ScpB [Acidobacteria bacterium]|nr:MAG: SMC-Scp complex subunit ScpB [Acidobacteriota bacterium]
MVAEEAVPAELLAQVLEVAVTDVREALEGLAATYEQEERGFCVREVAGGWRYFSHPDEAPYVEHFVRTEQSPRISAAALETLAIVAYRQPVSRAQLSAIRGVNCEGVLRSLIVRGLVEEVGRDSGPGQGVLYGTTLKFLEQMGMNKLEELPLLSEFAPEPGTAELVEATLRGGADLASGAEELEGAPDGGVEKGAADAEHLNGALQQAPADELHSD